MKLFGSQILLQALKDEGVDTIFGYPGGAVLDIYDALVKTDIRHILVRHEQGAVHAADGYARASGGVGVALVTSGPGATNTVTGIVSAHMDSIPVVVLTGQVPTQLIGNDAFQEVDIIGITRPCTKHNYQVTHIEDIPRIIKEAFYIAKSGRPGPVVVDLPKDLMGMTTDHASSKEINLRHYNPTYRPNPKQLGKAVDLIKRAKKPLILAGGGVVLSKGSEALAKFAHRIQAPVASTLMGLGVFPTKNHLWLGMIGMHGTYCANMSSHECDLLLAVGVRFDDRVTGKTEAFARHAKIIHIDIDPTSIRKNIPVTIPIVGDCKLTIEMLNELLEAQDINYPVHEGEQWLSQIDEWRKNRPLSYEKSDVIKPQYVIEKLYELTGGEAIVTTEVGQNQMWAAQYYHFERPNCFITSGGLGCMGFGLPAAIGAQVACPDKLVVDIAGDGSIQMNIQELATAVQHQLPIKIVILNNQYLGMVRQWQELFYDRCYAFTGMEQAPDFLKLANAYGAVGLKAIHPEDVKPVLEQGLSTPETVIMEFLVDREEKVYPMVPAGAPISQMLLV